MTRSPAVFALCSLLLGCDPDCPLEDGEEYRLHIFERYGPNGSYVYDEGYDSLLRCELDDFVGGEVYDFSVSLDAPEAGEACDATMTLHSTPSGLSSLEREGQFDIATTPSGCRGVWSISLGAGDPKRPSTPGQRPAVLMARNYFPQPGCDLPNAACRDYFVVQVRE